MWRINAIAISLGFLSTESRANLITNGDFATGDLTGWTVFTTANGSNGSGLPTVTSFDVTGGGAQNAGKFEVGEVNFTGAEEGGGLSQTVSLGAGLVSFSVNIAATGDGTHTNSEGGVFSVLLDGVTEATFDAGQITANQIIRDTLSFTDSVAAGAHTFELLVTRPFITAPNNTPFEYLTNASLTEPSEVPEPGSLALLLGGLLGGAIVRRGARLRLVRRRAWSVGAS